jgi:tRNA A-37 threonylcarbamoyl transferase component Bud32
VKELFAGDSPPAGYAHRQEGPTHLVCVAEWKKFQKTLMKQDFDSLPLWEGAKGRAPLRRLALSGRSDALVRAVRRGGLLRCWRSETFGRPKRFLKELEASERLRAAGLRTPRILALKLEKTARGALRRPGWRAWTVLEPVAGAEPLREALLSSAPERGEALAEQAARLLWGMHEAGAVHADPHAGNFLANREGVWLLDLDKAKISSRVGPLPRVGNLLRFVRSLEKIRAQGFSLSPGLGRHFLDSYAARMKSTLFSALLGGLAALHGLLRPARVAWWRATGAA